MDAGETPEGAGAAPEPEPTDSESSRRIRRMAQLEEQMGEMDQETLEKAGLYAECCRC